MKKISLKKLTLNNFKGIKSLELEFNEELTNILGDNGSGKTTVFDAFTWLLFGKDHNDNSQFGIKTLNSKNKAIPRLNHDVEALLLVNNEEVTIKRIYKEKWVKQRGSIEAVLTGHETAYFYNDVPVTLTEFGNKISELINESIFKLITNPFYFNSLPWTSRRSILTNIANIISDNEIAKTDNDFVKLLEEMSGKSFDDFKRVINAKKKKVKDELSEIPTRVDEMFKSLPEEENFKAIKKDVSKKNKEIDKLVEQIIDGSKVDETFLKKIKEKNNSLYELEKQKSEFEDDIRKTFNSNETVFNNILNTKKSEIEEQGFELRKQERRLQNAFEERRNLETKISQLRKEFGIKQSEQIDIDENQFSCPTCKREFIQIDIDLKREEMISTFNTNKATALEAINIEGKKLKSSFEKADLFVKATEKLIAYVKSNLEVLNGELIKIELEPRDSVEQILKNSNYKEFVKKVEKSKKEIDDLRNKSKGTDIEIIKSLEQKREKLRLEIDELNQILFKEVQISNGKKRISELEEHSTVLAQELSDLERKEFLVDKFNSKKINIIEEAINSLFPTVKFRLFNYQLNGGVSECCETLIDGVPFEDANNAAKISKGIEIINVLSEHHNCLAPIFVDNAESIVRTPFTKSQLIRLVVSENFKNLTVKY